MKKIFTISMILLYLLAWKMYEDNKMLMMELSQIRTEVVNRYQIARKYNKRINYLYRYVKAIQKELSNSNIRISSVEKDLDQKYHVSSQDTQYLLDNLLIKGKS